jgi:hypothetical protein
LPARAPVPDVKPDVHQIPVIAHRNNYTHPNVMKVNQKLAKDMENRPNVMRALKRVRFVLVALL